MKTMLVVAGFAGFLMLSSTAYGQQYGATGNLNGAGSLNSANSLGSGGGVNGAGSINAPSTSSAPVSAPSAPGAIADRNVNQNSKNPGDYVPSKFTNYGEAVALGEIEMGMRPLTVAEAARLAQQKKKDATNAKPSIVLVKDDAGKLVIAPTASK
jgi:hypothetical protein